MTGLNVTIIVTRDSHILSTDHVRDTTDFADGNVALAYQQALNEWVASRPDPNDVGSWRPQTPVIDPASSLAAELGRIIQPRDAAIFPDTDPEAISAAAEHRPYDADAIPTTERAA